MQLSTYYGFAFLCTPKCASTSIEYALHKSSNVKISGHPNIKHMNARSYVQYIAPMLHDLTPKNGKVETFCIIREPMAWIESWYRFRSRDELKNPKHPNHANYTGNMSFTGFVEDYVKEGKRPPHANVESQYDFVRLESGEVGVDYIFPMEQLDVVAEYLRGKIGESIKFPEKNVSPKKKVDLDPEVEERLRKHSRESFLLYDFVKTHGRFERKMHAEAMSGLLGVANS